MFSLSVSTENTEKANSNCMPQIVSLSNLFLSTICHFSESRIAVCWYQSNCVLFYLHMCSLSKWSPCSCMVFNFPNENHVKHFWVVTNKYFQVEAISIFLPVLVLWKKLGTEKQLRGHTVVQQLTMSPDSTSSPGGSGGPSCVVILSVSAWPLTVYSGFIPQVVCLSMLALRRAGD